MILRLFDTGSDKTLVNKEYSTSFFDVDIEPVKEQTTYIDGLGGKGYYREIYFDDVHIGFGDILLVKSLHLGFESNFETVEMHFSLKGKNIAHTFQLDKDVCFSGYAHNIIYGNNISGDMQWDNSPFQQLEINLTPRFFKKHLPQNIAIFDTFRNVMEKGKSGLLMGSHYPITIQMHDVLSQILHCQRKGFFKKMFLESKVIELLLLQLEQFTTVRPYSGALKQSDRDKIHAVRDFIIKNIGSTYSLSDLAREVGTNDFILKKGFKEIFGTTVFSFWANERMTYAKRLLVEQELTVGEVSDLVGYKNQRHFSSAFKKKTPSHKVCKLKRTTKVTILLKSLLYNKKLRHL